MEMNYIGTACRIFKRFVEVCGEIPPKTAFFAGYKNLADWVKEESQPDFDLKRVMESCMPDLMKVRQMAESNTLSISALDCMMLVELLKVLEDIFNNRRYQDPFGSLFVTHLKMFNLSNKKAGNGEKRRYLRSKEVIWAIHSQQPEGLFDVCFPSDLQASPQFMNWESFRRYCVPLWFEDGMKLKSYVEKIALIQYKQSR